MEWKYDVILSDIHIPYVNKKLLNSVFNFLLKELKNKIDTIYLAGDVIDFAQLSVYNNNPNRINNLQDDINQTIKFLYKLKRRLTPREIIYIAGNHEKRLEKYIIKNSKELFNLDILSFRNIFKLDDIGVKFVNMDGDSSFVTTPYNLVIGHFNKYSKIGGRASYLISKERSCSIVQAHTHKIGSSITTTIDDRYLESYECGCLCDITKAIYVTNPNWQNGFATIRYSLKKKKIFFYRQHLIKKYGSSYKVY